METATLDEQTVAHIWSLLPLGSAQSAGWGHHDTEHVPGSGYIFAYGVQREDGTQAAAVNIHNANGDERRIDPATQENVLQALQEMGITETDWSL